MNTYFILQNRLSIKRYNRESFSQIVGEHAEQLCELVKTESKRQIVTASVNIDHLCDEWVYLITRNDRPDSEFAKVTSRLIHMYSDILIDYIMDVFNESHKKKIVEIVQMEARFFEKLGSTSSLAQWINYACSVVSLTEVYAKYGSTSERFYVAASTCLRSGKLLGDALDAQLRH